MILMVRGSQSSDVGLEHLRPFYEHFYDQLRRSNIQSGQAAGLDLIVVMVLMV
jgi:hypothetical protein